MEKPVPTLPQISGDTILQVFTHPSLRHKTDARPEEYEDNARLTVLGEAALQMAVTSYLVRRRPMLSSDEMSVRSGYSNCPFGTLTCIAHLQTYKERLLCHDTYYSWVGAYGLRQKLRCHPDMWTKLMSPMVSGRNWGHPGRKVDHLGRIGNEETISCILGWFILRKRNGGGTRVDQ
jgi:hypothetical protein